MYTFALHHPRGTLFLSRSKKPGPRELLMSGEVFLRPLGWDEETTRQALNYATASYRAASATCIEARQAVLTMLPDTLAFRGFPKTWRHTIDRENKEGTSPDAEGYPTRTLRFNGLQDVIVFETFRSSLREISTMSATTGKVPPDFLNIRHVVFTVNMFEYLCKVILDFYPPPGGVRPHCKCTAEECRSRCVKDPFTDFLSLFPELKRLCIVGPTASSSNIKEDLPHGKSHLGSYNCPCPPDHPRPSWPLIKNAETEEFLTVYDERSCPFPKFKVIETLRQEWRPDFPYYQALEHLDIKFVQACNSGPQI